MRKFTKGNHDIHPKIPSRCTVEQMAKISEETHRHCENQQKLADHLIKQSELVIDATRTKTDQCKHESDYRIKERIQHIEFLQQEIANRKKEASIEEKTIKTYCKRIINGVKFIKDIQEKNSQQASMLNGQRDNVELINDPIDREMHRENILLKSHYDKLDKTLMQLIEQSRLLRAIIYALDNELLRKSTSLEIDKNNLDLKTNFEAMRLSGPNGTADLVVTTQHEWEELTSRLLKNAFNEISSSKQLRSFVDVTLNYTIEELSKQVDRTNDEFRKRIHDAQHAKAQLEQLQLHTQQKIADMLKNINDLQIELDAKQKYLALCHNRLQNRAMRPGTELCRDRVQDTLAIEMQTLRQTIHRLKQMIDESNTTHRHLLHTKQLESEEMDRLNYRLQVDSVDCMTVRECIAFTTF